MKVLSIIVPLYNSEKYLPKCLTSLENQDIPREDYEIILVNDGSPDGSKALAEEYAVQYPNIVVLSQENKGTSGARNTGLRYASGKYTYFVDPDDYILENSLKCIIDRMEEESLDILRFGYTEVDEQYNPTKSCKHPETPDYSSKVMDGYSFMAERLGIACYVWTFIFRTSLLKDNNIYCYEGDYFDDTPWLPRVMALAKRVDSIDIKRHFYLIRSGSLVQSTAKSAVIRKVNGHQFLIKELKQQMADCPRRDACQWYGMMITHCVVSLLSLVGTFLYDDKKQFLSFLRSQEVYPLSRYKASMPNRLKIALVNFSPRLYCRLIHIKNS